MLELKRLTSESLGPYLSDLARLRIQVFRDFPYLYDGDYYYETRYLRTYTESPDSVVVLAMDGDQVVGASTGIPLTFETGEVKAPFLETGLDVSKFFYFGESVLLSPYRGRGCGAAFFDHREAHARELGGYEFSCFCAVERPADHPHRPVHYKPLDDFWRKRGYEKRANLRTTFSWKEIGESEETPKSMTFWTKSL